MDPKTYPTAAEALTPEQFNGAVERIVKGLMEHGQTRLEALRQAIEDLGVYIFDEGDYPDSDIFTLYSTMGMLWTKLASAEAEEMTAPVARA